MINIGDDWIEDNLFDNHDEEATNDVSDDIIDTTNGKKKWQLSYGNNSN